MWKMAGLSAALALSASAWPAMSAPADDASAMRQAEYAVIRQNICPAPSSTPAASAAAPDEASLAIEPFKAFDNLYFVGNKAASSWVLTTSDGIILFDAMFAYNVKDTVEAGMRKLGLDPADIKYVIVAHGHNDHFGGAQYLRDTYGARVVISKLDWDYMLVHPQLGREAPLPARDIEAKDGDVIAVGDASVRLVLTPGHSPGTLSPIFPVKDNGVTHYVGYWGGAAMSYLDPPDIETYIRSVKMYQALDPRVDVELSNHVFADGALAKRDALAARKAGEPNPFVVGNAAFREWMGVMASCADSVLTQKRKAAQ
jgi:metallo-beta-lactamase class B